MDKTCAKCRFFRAKFHELGICDRQESSGSMIHTKGEDAIYVATSFGCRQFEAPPDLGKEIL